MSTMRARRHEPFVPPESVDREPLLTVRAGEKVVLRIAAVDYQSGVAEVVVRCRSRDDHEIASVGRWSRRMPGGPAGDRYYPVVVPIPSGSPSVVWELQQITLRDGEGNLRNYEPGRDFDEMLFRVQGREDVDCTPPRLLGIKIGTA